MNLRDAMPNTAELIDALRESFGAATINASIRKGMAGIPGYFHATENGHEVGTPALFCPNTVCLTDMVLESIDPLTRDPNAHRNASR